MVLDSVSQKNLQVYGRKLQVGASELGVPTAIHYQRKYSGYSSNTGYCLMERLDQAAYQELLNILVQECGNRGIALAPQTIHVDFELAVINSVRNTFPNVTVVGCFYHLCQVSLSPLKMILNSLNTGILLRRHLSVDAGNSQKEYCFLN